MKPVCKWAEKPGKLAGNQIRIECGYPTKKLPAPVQDNAFMWLGGRFYIDLCETCPCHEAREK